MKSLVIITLLITTIGFSQDFQGRATYKSHKKMNIKINTTNGQGLDSSQKKLQESLKRLGQKTYVLSFDKSTSTYKEQKSLGNGTSEVGKVITMFGSGKNQLLFKNITKKNYLEQRDLGGKMFLIDDKLETIDWKLSSDTKKIGSYTCYKATNTKEVEKNSFIMVDGKHKPTKKKVQLVTTAWYTPQIPISNGPGLHAGLPGLILEVQQGKTSILCVELVLNSKEISIKKPKKGEKVTKEEFKILKQKFTEELLHRFGGNKKSKGQGIHIKIN